MHRSGNSRRSRRNPCDPTRGCPEEASANLIEGADEEDATDYSLVVDAEACALARVEPCAKGHRGIRLAIGCLAHSGPDS